ncbi:MAG: guanylate kinase [bacterium]
MDSKDIKLEDKNLHMDGKPKGLIFAVSAPSGTGKTTLCNMLLQEFKDIKPSVSFTTRVKRQGEEDGISYHFINDAEFDKMIERDEFIEWANVFGKRYGTAYKSVSGQNYSFDALLEIDVQGVEKLLKISEGGKNLNNPVKLNKPVTIFIMPPTHSELAVRLQKRGNMAQAELNKRLEVARAEIKKSGIYDYTITNDNLDDAYIKLKSIIVAERCKNLRK